MIKLNVDTTVSGMTWTRFIGDGFNRIALDGYVYGAPGFNSLFKAINFNHHEEVDRLTTRATCSQVLLAVRQGVMDWFRDTNGQIKVDVFVNDCDQDVCLSWFILKNSFMCENSINPALNRLVHIEDMMDTCAGSYPFNKDLPILRDVAWVFQPYTEFRLNGGLDKKNNESYRSVIDDVENRIMQHITGAGGTVELDTSYEVLYGNNKWSLVREKGRDARMALLANGIRAFMSVRNRPDGKWAYSIGRMSPFVDFDVAAIMDHLNKVEDCKCGANWGGSDTIGGSPRFAGSTISPDKMPEIITKFLETHK